MASTSTVVVQSVVATSGALWFYPQPVSYANIGLPVVIGLYTWRLMGVKASTEAVEQGKILATAMMPPVIFFTVGAVTGGGILNSLKGALLMGGLQFTLTKAVTLLEDDGY